MSRTPAELLLQLRAMHEQLAQRRLASSRAAQREAVALVRRTTALLSEATYPDRGTAAQFVAANATRQSLAALVQSQREAVVEAEHHVHLAAAAWSETERDREAIERLVDDEKTERREKRDAVEQRESDDLATSRHAGTGTGSTTGTADGAR